MSIIAQRSGGNCGGLWCDDGHLSSIAVKRHYFHFTGNRWFAVFVLHPLRYIMHICLFAEVGVEEGRGVGDPVGMQ
jgi:hypothetical protein